MCPRRNAIYNPLRIYDVLVHTPNYHPSEGRIGFGLLLILAFSAGLAGVLTGIGLLMVYARSLFERLGTNGPLVRWMPVVSAGVVTIAGAIITM